MTDLDAQRPQRTTILMAGLLTGVLLTMLDQTMVSTALPTVVADLGGLSLYAWTFSAYMLGQTAFLPIFGRLSDLYGQRRLYVVGVTLFLLGAVLSGQARTMEQLILFQGLQGIGGAGLMPVALAILGVHYGPEARARLQGVLGGGAGLAVIAGPTAGALIVENLSWRWVFYVNLPLGLVSVFLVLVALRGWPERAGGPPMDYRGATLLVGWVVAVMLAVFLGRDVAWTSAPVVGLLATASTLLVLFLVHERRRPEPILPLHIFAHPTVAAAGAVAFIRAVATYALILYVPLLVEGVRGGTAEDVRNALTVFALPGIVGAVVAGLLVGQDAPYRLVMGGGLVLSGAGLWLVSQTGPAAAQGLLFGALALASFGIGLTQVTIVLAIQNAVARRYMGTASSLSQFLNNLAGTLGIGLLGAYQAYLLAGGVAALQASPVASQLPPQAAAMLRDQTSVGRALTTPAIAAQFPPDLVAALRTALERSLEGVFQVGLVLTTMALLASVFMRGSAAAGLEEEFADRTRDPSEVAP